MHLLLDDRRRPPQVQEADALEALRNELRARLLGHDRDDAAELLHEMALVHDLLGRRG